MNLRDILLVLLANRALAQTSISEQEYETLCVDKDGATQEIIPGYWVEYKCDHLGPNDGQQIEDISSAVTVPSFAKTNLAVKEAHGTLPT